MGTPDGGRDEEEIDGCGIAVEESEIIRDWELPVAAGGVEIAPPDDPGEEADGCDLDFAADEQTSDAELPPAVGGVA